MVWDSSQPGLTCPMPGEYANVTFNNIKCPTRKNPSIKENMVGRKYCIGGWGASMVWDSPQPVRAEPAQCQSVHNRQQGKRRLPTRHHSLSSNLLLKKTMTKANTKTKTTTKTAANNGRGGCQKTPQPRLRNYLFEKVLFSKLDRKSANKLNHSCQQG